MFDPPGQGAGHRAGRGHRIRGPWHRPVGSRTGGAVRHRPPGNGKYAGPVPNSPSPAMVELGRAAVAAGRVVARSSSAARDDALRFAADLLEERARRRSSRPTPPTSSGPRRPGPTPPRSTGSGSTPAASPAWPRGLRDVAALPDPVGEVVDGWVRPNGLRVERVRVPLGVIGIIYENRPNVTSDAAGLCLKSGNAVLAAGLVQRHLHQPGGGRRPARRPGQGRPARWTRSALVEDTTPRGRGGVHAAHAASSTA